MRKVIVAFNGKYFSEGAMEFIRNMHKAAPVAVTGVFLPQTDYSGLWTYGGPLSGGFYSYSRLADEENSDEVKANIASFEKSCLEENISYQVHKNFYDFALSSLVQETRFADIAVFSGQNLYSNMGKNEHYEYLKELLHAAECPVILVPEQLKYPAANIIAFDGTESSIYAIKQFVYLFPDLLANKTLLVYANEDDGDLPFAGWIEEFVKKHFSDIAISTLQFDGRKYFATWCSEQKSAILISGAFSRSYFVRMFRKSFVAETISEHDLPVFIAHR